MRRLAALALLLPAAARAHEGHPPTAGEVLTTWSFPPAVLVPVALAAALFVIGRRRLAARGRSGTIRGWEAAAFWSATAAVLLALVSPVDRYSEQLFSVHMGQHELLMIAAAPLYVLARPLVAFLAALPVSWQPRAVAAVRSRGFQRAWRFLTAPLVAIVLHGIVRWAWHLPVLFEAALGDGAIHAVQHLTFFVTASLFWWSIVHGRYGRAGYGVAVLAVFATAAHTGLLGALIALAPTPFYRSYEATARALGTDAASDQVVAGMVMWVLAGTLLTLVALALFAAWIGEAGRRARREAP
jgi:putative membrane protein